MAKKDLLTGFLSKSEVKLQVGKLAARAEKTGNFSAVFGDLDYFSGYNTYSHNVGDEVLRKYGEVAREYVEKVNRSIEDESLKGISGLLKKNIRRAGRAINFDFLAEAFSGQVDTVKLFRYGGEETFLISTVDRERVREIAEGLRKAVEGAQIVPEEHPEARKLTISVGYNSSIVGGNGFQNAAASAREGADFAVEYSKLLGRNLSSGNTRNSAIAEILRSAVWNMHYSAMKNEDKINEIASLLPEPASALFRDNITLMKSSGVDPNSYREVLGFSDAVSRALLRENFNIKDIPNEYTQVLTPSGNPEPVSLPSRDGAKREIGKTQASGREENSIVMIDLDNFSVKNQRYGHTGGDVVLGRVAKAIEETVSEYNRANEGAGIFAKARKIILGAKRASAIRYGGEEFIISVGGGVESARELAEKVQERISRERIVASPSDDSPITASIGISGGKENSQELISWADDAANYSKLMGRNRITEYSQEVRKAEIVRDLTYKAYSAGLEKIVNVVGNKSEFEHNPLTDISEQRKAEIREGFLRISNEFAKSVKKAGVETDIDTELLGAKLMKESKLLYSVGVEQYDTRRIQGASDCLARSILSGDLFPGKYLHSKTKAIGGSTGLFRIIRMLY